MTHTLQQTPLNDLLDELQNELGVGDLRTLVHVCGLTNLSIRGLQHLALDDESVDIWFPKASREQREKIKQHRFGVAHSDFQP